MSHRPKQVSLFFDAAHSTSSEVIPLQQYQRWHSSSSNTSWWQKNKHWWSSQLLWVNWFRSLFSRFTVETVHICQCFSEVCSEFHRCISAWFVSCDIQVFLYLLNSSEAGQWEWISCANVSISMDFSSFQLILSCESRYVESRWKRSWILSNFFLRHLLRALWAKKCCFGGSIWLSQAPRGRPFLMT